MLVSCRSLLETSGLSLLSAFPKEKILYLSTLSELGRKVEVVLPLSLIIWEMIGTDIVISSKIGSNVALDGRDLLFLPKESRP
jgi:hypothetical protein